MDDGLNWEVTAENVQKRLMQFPHLLASAEVAGARRIVCDVCKYKYVKMGFDSCNKCECFLEFKTRYANSKCPENKW